MQNQNFNVFSPSSQTPVPSTVYPTHSPTQSMDQYIFRRVDEMEERHRSINYQNQWNLPTLNHGPLSRNPLSGLSAHHLPDINPASRTEAANQDADDHADYVRQGHKHLTCLG